MTFWLRDKSKRERDFMSFIPMSKKERSTLIMLRLIDYFFTRKLQSVYISKILLLCNDNF